MFGRTNMVPRSSRFLASASIPHYGTPATAGSARRGRPRAGGSSSGAGVSVADGMLRCGQRHGTGGGVRIPPPAFNGLVGFKPTAFRCQ